MIAAGLTTGGIYGTLADKPAFDTDPKMERFWFTATVVVCPTVSVVGV